MSIGFQLLFNLHSGSLPAWITYVIFHRGGDNYPIPAKTIWKFGVLVAFVNNQSQSDEENILSTTSLKPSGILVCH